MRLEWTELSVYEAQIYLDSIFSTFRTLAQFIDTLSSYGSRATTCNVRAQKKNNTQQPFQFHSLSQCERKKSNQTAKAQNANRQWFLHIIHDFKLAIRQSANRTFSHF